MLHQPLGELEVNFLWGMTRINQYEDATQVGSLGNVIRDELIELIAMLARGFGIPVAGEVDECPLLVDDEKVNQAGAPRRTGDHSEIFFASKGVD